MTHAVEKGNLPDQAELVLLGQRYASLLDDPLRKLGVSPLYVPDNPMVDQRLSGHADLSVFHPGGDTLYLAPYYRGSSLHESLLANGFRCLFPEWEQGPAYPYDAALNACVMGDAFLYNPGVTAPEIVSTFDSGRFRMIPVRQGYVKCSVCVLDDSSLITSDAGIAAAAREKGLNVLQIRPGYVRLDGYPYGFIGGAAFKASHDLMFFTGSLDLLPEREQILFFLEEHGIRPVYLTELPLFDVGSILPITENLSALVENSQ